MPYRPGPAGWIRCARASTSSAPAGLPRALVPVSAAAAYGVEVRAGMQAEQPERAGGVGGQVPVGPGEHRPRPRSAGRRRRRAGPAAAAGRPARRPGRPAGTPGRAAASSAATRSASGSRAHWAASGRRGLGLGVDPARRSAGRSRATASAGGQQVQVQPAGAVAGRPARPARRGWSPRTTQPALPGSSGRTCSTVRGVVQHDQHPPAGQQAAVPGGALVQLRPGCPGRARRARAGTRPARRPAVTGWSGS